MSASDVSEKVVRGSDPRSLDAVVAAVLAIFAVAVEAARHAGAVPLIALAACAATVSLRRRTPAVACLAAFTCIAVFQHSGGTQGFQIAVIVAALDYYMLGHDAGDHSRRATMAVVLTFPIAATAAGPDAVTLMVLASRIAAFVLLPFAAGWVIATRGALTEQLRAGTERLAREQPEHARRAASEERILVARELHDVVAHSVSVMVIQAVAARRVAGQDRELALEALRSVESCGREALSEMRRMVGVLRRSELEPVAMGGPDLSQLEVLVDRAVASGLPVQLVIDGERRGLPTGVELAAFRIVQEALTNTLKHAGPARAQVTVRYTASTLELDIVDTGHGSRPRWRTGQPGGNGLVGMQERISVYAGELQAGKRPDGGFQVTARIPIGEGTAT